MTERIRSAVAEGIGTAGLLAAVVGSGIMAERLSGGNDGLALLANTIATGAALFVLISTLASVSGAHFNPAVTLVSLAMRRITGGTALHYLAAQLAGAVLGVVLAHAMFEMPIWQISQKVRTGASQVLSESVATAGLVLTIEGTRRHPVLVAASVALFITAAYWFTASTSFANPAVTFARALSDTFAGIRPADVPSFLVGQTLGATAGAISAAYLFRSATTRE